MTRNVTNYKHKHTHTNSDQRTRAVCDVSSLCVSIKLPVDGAYDAVICQELYHCYTLTLPNMTMPTSILQI